MHLLLINIPAPIDPIERGERFEDPLLEALGAEGIEAEYLGGGSSLVKRDGGMEIESCDIELEVADLNRALPVIRRVLTEAEAPPDTTISVGEPEEATYRLGDHA